MRAILLLVVVLSLAATAAGRDRGEKELRARRDALLAKPWVTKSPWITDYEKALATSKKSGKPIFAYLTRSYDP